MATQNPGSGFERFMMVPRALQDVDGLTNDPLLEGITHDRYLPYCCLGELVPCTGYSHISVWPSPGKRMKTHHVLSLLCGIGSEVEPLG